MNVFGSQKDFSTIITDKVSEYQLIFANQCFPLYTYELSEQSRSRKTALLGSQSNGCSSEATIHYHDIGDYLDREEKLKIIADANGLQNVQWNIIEQDTIACIATNDNRL